MARESLIASDSLALGRLLVRNARVPSTSYGTGCGRTPPHLGRTQRSCEPLVERTGRGWVCAEVIASRPCSRIAPNLCGHIWPASSSEPPRSPLSPLLLPDGLRSLLADATPRVVVSDTRFCPTVQQVRAEIDPEPVWALIDGALSGFEDPQPACRIGGCARILAQQCILTI